VPDEEGPSEVNWCGDAVKKKKKFEEGEGFPM
jgi:hypothetical protein